MVRLVDADIDQGVLLLERLAAGQSLQSVPVDEAMVVLGRMMRRLAVLPPRDVPSTATMVRTRSMQFEADWRRLDGPFDREVLAAALAAAARVTAPGADLAVNGDLHSQQVLRGLREPWLTVDPVLLRGDIEYDLARCLWTRLDEMVDAAEIRVHLATLVREARLDYDRARDWAVFRTVDYWLWGLTAGLTEHPHRCRRLLAALLS